MYTLLVTTWLALPLAPINPTAEDTIPAVSFHITAGIAGPNGIADAGPEISAKYELRPIHPIIVRAALEYKYTQTRGFVHPLGGDVPIRVTGRLSSGTAGLDLLYYHGTSKLTGLIGFGVVYGFNQFDASTSSATELMKTYGINDVDMSQKLGYRLTLGLRYSKSYSMEVGITDIRPDIIYHRQYGPAVSSSSREQVRISGFRITLGYLLTLRGI